MTSETKPVSKTYWFVGAVYGDEGDQSPRFLKDGIWENGYRDRYLDQVRAIRPGDRIAIKVTYTRKQNLPFDNRGQPVSVMAIKAVGVVTDNPGDGRTVHVKWERLDPPQEWYFHTNRKTVWQVRQDPNDWMASGLIAFTFENAQQDIDRFRNYPYWRERYGDRPEKSFEWTPFYEAIADALRPYAQDRRPLVAAIHEIGQKLSGLSNLNDRTADGATFPLEDICPFTTMGIFNRGTTEANRKDIARELADFLGVDLPVPNSFEGVPVLMNQRSWFFAYQRDRGADDIDTLWDAFEKAIQHADADEEGTEPAFARAFDEAMMRRGVGWNLTMGLYWTRPWAYPTLDSPSQNYIEKKLEVPISRKGSKGRTSAADYLDLTNKLRIRFQEQDFIVHSFPELSLAAWQSPGPVDTDSDVEPGGDENIEDQPSEDEGERPTPPIYTVDDIVADGAFVDRTRLQDLIERLGAKKNLILQGPPGTGKTWVAKRLAFALIGYRDDNCIHPIQFHANLSYEDFVRGWRPAAEGRLTLVDGPFLRAASAAAADPTQKHVVVIEEINRGNPAQIFGEMLTLLESDKRTPNEALALSYPRERGERIHLPGNLFLIGTMNVADRSLALVDLALRRRFAFAYLEPTLGSLWRDWLTSRCRLDSAFVADVERRMTDLNSQIASDATLGPQFQIGHSYVTPRPDVPIPDPLRWFRQIIETEIGPLLDEYWFDSPDRADGARKRLLDGLP
ncbi:MAG: AAA family ATPase [Dehalococcoidia bacterium]